MKGVLKELTDARRADAEALAARLPFAELERMAQDARRPLDFASAFRGDGVHVISELKRASPSAGMIREDFRPVELARELEAAGAAALSVLCEPHRFLGGEEYLRAVRKVVGLPILYKDFISTRYQIAAARVAGADAVLLIAAALCDAELRELLAYAHSLGLSALVETHDADEIARAVESGARIIGVNCRDLRDFSTDVSLLERLVALIPPGRVRIAESGMHSPEAVARARAAGADGFLIGTALMKAERPGDRLREIIAGAAS